MHINLEVELTEKRESDNKVETRLFSRVVEMEPPVLRQEVELNVAGDAVRVVVTRMFRSIDDGIYQVRVTSPDLTFKSLREDERWSEKVVS
jgi:hypothetical protein